MSWIQTYTGREVYPFELDLEDINIQDIAHSLALQCRFNGHSKMFYSVAEHCCRVSDICRDDLKGAGLLHDASEAYLSDIPSPIKDLLPEYKKAEQRIEKLIEYRFGIRECKNEDKLHVKECDLILLATEARDLMSVCKTPWTSPLSPLPEKIIPWDWQVAEKEFLIRAEKLGLK